jgi:hypothetical protein
MSWDYFIFDEMCKRALTPYGKRFHWELAVL